MKLKVWRSLLLGLCLSNAIVYAALRIAPQARAQIIPDGTTNTNVDTTDSVINIEEGDRAGDNLFHSFEEFSVPNGSEAFFSNANDIVNIFSRVTGGNISNIDGLIRANGDASLFLINPAGIIFGEGAALDIGGSFFASTADGIVFTDNIEFSATDATEPPLLTINQPLGLNFGSNPGDIAVNGSNLQVGNGETLALFGGNLTITGGQIIAPAANIELGGLTATGQISFIQSENTFNSFSFPEAIAKGNMTLTNSTKVNVQAAGGGSIEINARNLELSDASNLRTGIAPESTFIGTFSPDAASMSSDSTEAQTGNININATDDITVSQDSRIDNRVEELGVGNAGEIKINTNHLFLKEGGLITASIFGEANPRTIVVDASGNISADGESESSQIPSGIYSQVVGVSDSGGIEIRTTNLSLTQGGQVSASTFGDGNAGTITINATDTVSVDGETSDGIPSSIDSRVSSIGVGDPGGIEIRTTNLSLTQGGRVTASTRGQGNAGAITINASDTISVDGEASDGIPSSIDSIISSIGVGDPGGIEITTTNLSLTQGGRVTASTFGDGNAGTITINATDTVSVDGEALDGFPSSIDSIVTPIGIGDSGGIEITTTNLSLTQGGRVTASTLGQGDAGDLTVTASESIELVGSDGEVPSGFFANTIEGSGDGGNLTIATDKLIVRDEAVITAGNFQQLVGDREPRPPGTGAAGNLEINAGSVEVGNRGKITTDNANGIGGNLTLNADSMTLENEASVSASTIAEQGQGGIVTLDIDDSLILSDLSLISARADSGASGGNIDLKADFVIAQPNQNNDIIASATEGAGGDIDITTNAIFGLEERSSSPPNNTNDIDASSEFGLDGTIQINKLEVNPTEALEELPIEIIDVTGLVEQNLCQQGQGSEFVVTGKGGIAPSPTQARDGSVSEVDLVKPVPYFRAERAAEANSIDEEEIIEAQGWVVNDRGMVELVARKTDVNSSPAQPKSIQVCH